MRFFTAVLISASTLVSHVAAHGYVQECKIDGKPYKGNNPFISPKNKVPSPIRFVDTTFPIEGSNNKNLPCGVNSQKAPLIAEAKPGSKIEIKWSESPNQPFAHEAGPIITYMAECDGPCNKYDATDAKWFKISEQGHKPNSAEWYMMDTYKNKLVSTTLPKNLKSGNYLLRHELIALHYANKGLGRAQFYPACIQLHVSGQETGVPRQTDLVSLPGAYKDSDRGLYDKNSGHFYVSDKEYRYPMPGPKVAVLVSSGSSGSVKPVDDAPKGDDKGTIDPTPSKDSKPTSTSKPNGASDSNTKTTNGPKATPHTDTNPDTNPSSCSSRKRMVKRTAHRRRLEGH